MIDMSTQAWLVITLVPLFCAFCIAMAAHYAAELNDRRRGRR